jgi:signal transduction histidine kinase
MNTLFFDPSARLQRYLGRELIGDPNLAIVEFVKNAYDAGASEVVIDFFVAGPPDSHEVVISDNGTGMGPDSFERNWMRPGFSYKARVGGSQAGDTPAGVRQATRVPSGEKGLGRLAAGRLGEGLHVYTRETAAEPWLHVTFDWHAFENMDRALREIPISSALGDGPPHERFPSGTVIRITDMAFNWTQLIRGRKLPGRSDSRLGRLREDLSLLLEPFTPAGADFHIVLGVDRPELSQFAGPVKPNELDVRDYVWEFTISPRSSGQGVAVVRRIRRSARVVAKTGHPAETVERKRRGGEDQTGRPTLLRSGPIHGVFYYSPPQIASRGEEFGRSRGVFLYRDRIRVEPYGSPDDDWLGVQARKASRQGWSAIQPNLLTGYVEISRAQNPGLVDMSNRNGLVENEAFEDLIEQLRAEVREFDRRLLDEVVRPNWTEPTVRARLAAKRAQSFGIALTRAVTHSVRGPVAAIGADLHVIERIAEALADQVAKSSILDATGRVKRHLREIDNSMARLMAFESLDLAQAIQDVDARKVVASAVERTTAFADSVGISVEVAPGLDEPVITEPRALEEAVAELVMNAIEATRAASRLDAVEVSLIRENGSVVVVVEDRGAGVGIDEVDKLFETSTSTRGRPGFGLMNTRELLALVNAEVELRSTSDAGSSFAITLPSAGETRKEA